MDHPYPCPNHSIHTHTFPELTLGSLNSSNQQPYFRAMIFFNKKPGLTDEFFHDHWKSVHADLTMQVPGAGRSGEGEGKGGFIRYVQFHQEQQHVDAMQELLEASGGTMKMAKWDGAAEFWASTAEEFVGFMKNVYASKTLVGCGTRFVDLVQGYEVMAGYDNLIFGGGVPGWGTDGILEGDERLSPRNNGDVEERRKVEVMECKTSSSVVEQEVRDIDARCFS